MSNAAGAHSLTSRDEVHSREICTVPHRHRMGCERSIKVRRFFSIRIGDLMNIHLSLTPMISLLAGILILVMPKLLNFIVAIYLIVIGLIGLFGTGALHFN